MREEDVPAEHPETDEEARLPHPYAHAWRARSNRSATREVALPPVVLIWRVRGRSSFRALARGRRRRSRGIEVIAARLGAPTDPPRVAYAVNRSFGSAVGRNRVRRGLREAVRAHAELLEPGMGYLVRPVAPVSSQSELMASLGTVLRELAEVDR